jgi:hypothetical protein
MTCFPDDAIHDTAPADLWLETILVSLTGIRTSKATQSGLCPWRMRQQSRQSRGRLHDTYAKKWVQTNLISNTINKTIITRGTITAFQSEDVAFGLFLIISIALGNNITKNMTNANAEIICIQSISSILPFAVLKKQNPG